MNRLSATAFPSRPPSTSARVERPALPGKHRSDAPHCLLAPLHYEPNYAYPLLVWLHGPGGSEREVSRVMPLVSLRNYAATSIRGPAEADRGYDWPQSPDAIQAAEQRIGEAVCRARERYNIHRERVFLCGRESGGTMAMRLALRHADRYAGAVSFNGPFPAGQAPLVNLSAARKSRLLIAHCRDSGCYPIERLCDELSLFHAAGMSVTLRQYPCGNELTTQMLHDMDVWLMEQITGASTGEAHPAVLPTEWN
jgi:phospholipase/carboxylesterase